jgi:hypothetical protein
MNGLYYVIRWENERNIIVLNDVIRWEKRKRIVYMTS